MALNKKKIINDVTIVDRDFLQSVFGGDSTAPADDPFFAGHFHDGRNDQWGHAPKVDLTNHTTGRLVLSDQYAVAKTLSLPSSSAVVIGNSLVWYFSLPTDMDITKPVYFSFNWMGDASVSNTIDLTNVVFQTTTFRVTWQWYAPDLAVFAPAVIYDAQPPTNYLDNRANVNTNTLSRGRIPALTVNAQPFHLFVNDSRTGAPNYVNLTGLDQTTGSVMVGVQVEVLSTGFISGVVFFNGTMLYLSKTLGGATTSISTLNG